MTHDAETVEAMAVAIKAAVDLEGDKPLSEQVDVSTDKGSLEFSRTIARAAASAIPQPSVKDAAKVLLDEYGRVRSGRLDKAQPHDGYIAALSGSALRAISEGE